MKLKQYKSLKKRKKIDAFSCVTNVYVLRDCYAVVSTHFCWGYLKNR